MSTRTKYSPGGSYTGADYWYPQATKGDAKMLPVKVSTPTVLPTERTASQAPSQSPSPPKQASRLIEIRLRNGHSIVVRGRVDAEALSRVIDLLVQR